VGLLIGLAILTVPTVTAEQSPTERVRYIDVHGHVDEIYGPCAAFPSNWCWGDLTGTSGNPAAPAAPGSPLSSSIDDHGVTHVRYIDVHGHVDEIYGPCAAFPSNWCWGDLTGTSGNPAAPAAPGSPLSTSGILKQSKSTTTNISQSGDYDFTDYGHSHGWKAGSPSPNPIGDGYNYADWRLTFNINAMSGGTGMTGGSLNVSWTTSKGVVSTKTHDYGLAAPHGDPLKSIETSIDGWVTRLEFSDGYSYPLSPGSPPLAIDFTALGLQTHLRQSNQLSVVGIVRYRLGRVYLDDSNQNDWQDGDGWAYSATDTISGGGILTATGTLSIRR
jgi:hypothetical protein